MPLKTKNKFIGIKDLLDNRSMRLSNLQDELIKYGVPGNWYCYHNVYNLINGAMPKDAYVLMFLADFFEEDMDSIIYRYSARKVYSTVVSRTQIEKKKIVEDLF